MKFIVKFLIIWAFCTTIQSLAYSNPLSRGRRDFLRMNLPVIGNKWPNRQGSLWVGLQASSAFIIYPKFGQRTGFLPLQVSVDHSIDDHWALGAYAGYFNSTYTDKYGEQTYQSKITGFNGGLRLTLHFADIFNNMFAEVLNLKKWDLYSTASAGWYAYNWQVDPIYTNTRDFSNASFGSFGLVVGVKWIPIPQLGIFVEGGKGPVGWVSFGISGKLVK